MATIKQNQMIVERIAEFQEKFSLLSHYDAQFIIQNASDAIDLFIFAVVNRAKLTVQADGTVLSSIIATFAVPATTEKFVAKEKFRLDNREVAKVKIFYLDDKFREWFLDKTENPSAGSTIVVRDIEQNSVDGPIIMKLGGDQTAETTLAELWAVMEAQPNGASGNLLNSGKANIFYIKDINGTLRVVFVFWSSEGWVVYARSVRNLVEWHGGSRVFSRNFVLKV